MIIKDTSKLIMVIFSVFCLFAVVWLIDKREVKLIRIGTIDIQPPVANLPCSLSACRGRDITSVLLEIEDWVKMDGNKHRTGPLTVIINPDTTYYLGIGCKIKKLTYYYHSKYTNALNNSSFFAINSSTLVRDDPGKINVYSGDVIASDITK